MASFEQLQKDLQAFVDERDWRQFHDPKSLILALVGEVGELAALYQWLPAYEAVGLSSQEPLRTRTAEEMADVLIYLVGLAESLGLDLLGAASAKLDAAAKRFPTEEHFGRAPDKQ